MSYEKAESKSGGYGLHEEWEALGEVVLDSWLLPETILGGFIEDFFGDSTK